ncbi:hypothetical protein [Pseudomonas citrulli]|uniref:Uncharacterized protein n=1 Tax=Pseudomonas citrulli TaxID=3064347 RepID=A0ABT9C1T9_9PSED|nr:hypothetical protein [Pseudomonas sp. K18]MDO7898775.1 hypothetical protein [Pseudomonas sp. K18]
MPRSKRFTQLFVALLAVAALWYMWTITSAKLEWGGDSPDRQQVGAVKDTRQRAMTQYCTGVVATPKGTWLVGRLERDAQALEPGAEVQDLDVVVYGKPKETEAAPQLGAFSIFSARETETSFISRLDAQGQFQLVAHVSGAACLVASPDGASLFLLTGLDRPDAETSEGPRQTVVLRSDDQGMHWTWLKNGFFADTDQVAWSLEPYFHGQDEVWAWGSLSEIGAQKPDGVATGLFYSADRGATSTPIVSAESLLVTAQYARDQRPDVVQWHTEAEDQGEIRGHVIQVDGQRALIWLSQRFWGSHPDGKRGNIVVNVTTRAELQRQAGKWQIVARQRDDKLFIDALAQNEAGRVFGLIDQGHQGRDVVAELDTSTQTWRPVGELPSVFAPLASDSRLRGHGFWAGQNTLLINTSSEHRPPRWLYWWSDASISADGVFYSRDWGRSWHKLAVDGYLGVLGFQPGQDRVFWAKGNWYDNNDLGVYAYGLR